MSSPPADLQVEPITNENDFPEAYATISTAFGTQLHDAIWIHAARLAKNWRSITTDRFGRPNAVFLKATLPDPDQTSPEGEVLAKNSGIEQREEAKRRRIVGIAIWVQASDIQGYGESPSSNLPRPEYLEEIYPGDERSQRFVGQVWLALLSRRIKYVQEKGRQPHPNILALDLCATHPSFQRRGVAAALVQWGLDETKRRNIDELCTEASGMGRGVYAKIGFQARGGDFEYEEVDAEFKGGGEGKVKLPPNVFMLYRL
ncbi:hypothetical protein F5Y16DRAFT_413576 [Xylariaceae sp. FL0255]|nr:hypothetical protein F5Y16DRAFT_413576 [Xylariaceae sp. FL0255]